MTTQNSPTPDHDRPIDEAEKRRRLAQVYRLLLSLSPTDAETPDPECQPVSEQEAEVADG